MAHPREAFIEKVNGAIGKLYNIENQPTVALAQDEASALVAWLVEAGLIKPPKE